MFRPIGTRQYNQKLPKISLKFHVVLLYYESADERCVVFVMNNMGFCSIGKRYFEMAENLEFLIKR